MVQARKILVVRTFLGVAAMSCYFYALTHMPLAECIFIGRSQPLILAILAPFVVGEKTPKAAWFSIATGLIGASLIMKPAMAWPLAAWVALAAAGAAAMAQLMVRRLNRTDHPLTIVFNFLVLTTLLTSIFAMPGFIPLSNKEWLLVAGVAVLASLGQLLMTFAYRYDSAPAVASASYSSVVLSVIYGYVFWGEIPHPLVWVGGFFIVSGGVMLVKSRIKTTEPA